MNTALSAASEITFAVGFGCFLWGLPVPAAALAVAATLLSLYRRRLGRRPG